LSLLCVKTIVLLNTFYF